MAKGIDLYEDMKGMYLSGASIRSIVKMYGIASGYEIIDTLNSIKSELSTTELNTRKLNKTKIKLDELVVKHRVLGDKELKHQERVRHFKTKRLVVEQSLIKLQACIDKLNTV